MATINGTVKGVSLATGSPAGVTHTLSSVVYVRKSYLCVVDFAAYTGSTDDGSVTGLGAAITAFIRDGRTRTLRADAKPVCVAPGADTNAQAVFVGTTTVSTDDITFNLTTGAGTEVTTSTACSITLLVPVDETPV